MRRARHDGESMVDNGAGVCKGVRQQLAGGADRVIPCGMSARFELRTIDRDERDTVLDLLGGWLPRDFFARYFAHDPTFRDDLCFVASEAGRLVSTLQVFRKTVQVDGADLQVAGVGNVYTDPAYRTAGLASALLERAVAAMREHEFDLSLLFASRLDFYGRLGWRSHLRYLSFIEPGGPSRPPAIAIDPFDPSRDLAAVMAVYARYSGAIAGATVRDPGYWQGQLRYAGNPEERFLVARRGGDLQAYARVATLYEFNTVIEHGCGPDGAAALADLLGEIHRGAATGTLAQIVPSADLESLLGDRGLTVRRVEDRSWMWRVINPERVAARLRLPPAVIRSAGFFEQLFPAERSRYWLSDRF
jgi:GNAT superfamily N-acetyltransferase